MTHGSRFLRLGLLTVVLWWGNNPVSFAGTPIEEIKNTIDRVLAVLQDPAINGEGKNTEKIERLRQVLLPRFDFAEMAKRSLGSHWRRHNGRQEEFVSVFTDYVENAYVSKLQAFRDEQIVYVRELVDANFAQVDTKIIPSNGEEFSIKYKLHIERGEWKVYDVVVENISMVNNYRSQFNRVISKESFDELLKRLREKGSSRNSQKS